MPRPTLASLRQELADTRAELADARAAADSAERASVVLERRLDERDPESVAIDECVRALEKMAMTLAQRAACDRSNVTSYAVRYPDQPSPFASTHGRVLLHLAQRYGIAIVPIPAPEPPAHDPDEDTLIVSPRWLADKLEELMSSGQVEYMRRPRP